MDTATRDLLAKTPGSIGDTARAYAISFSRIVPERTENLSVFNNGLYMVIIARMESYKEAFEPSIGKHPDNLLLPVHTKGVDEIHRLFDLATPVRDIIFKLDLPSMTLYSMLLESKSYRDGFTIMDKNYTTSALEIIYEETKRACSHQVLFDKSAYVINNTSTLKKFLQYIEHPSLPAAIAAIFSGKEYETPISNRLNRLKEITQEVLDTNEILSLLKKENSSASTLQMIQVDLYQLETERDMIRLMTDKEYEDFFDKE